MLPPEVVNGLIQSRLLCAVIQTLRLDSSISRSASLRGVARNIHRQYEPLRLSPELKAVAQACIEDDV
jgi:hypothetical protein